MSKVALTNLSHLKIEQRDIQQQQELFESFENSARHKKQNQEHNSFNNNHYFSFPEIKKEQNCFRCLQAKSVYKCFDCHDFIYCSECFRSIHIGTKFQGHRIENLNTKQPNKSQKQSNQSTIELRKFDKAAQKFENIRNCIFYKENSNYTSIRNLIIQTQTKYEFISTKNDQIIECIKRKWENIEKQVKKQFEKIIHALNDQQNLLLNTLKTKSQQDIQYTTKLYKINKQLKQLKDVLSDSNPIQMQYNLVLPQELTKKIKKISDQLQNFKGNKIKYIDLVISKQAFEEFKPLITKIDFKNIFEKSKQNYNISVIQQNSNMKLSCILTNNQSNKAGNKQKNRSLANYTKNYQKLKIKKPNDVNDSFLSIIEDKYEDKKMKKIKSQTHIPYEIPSNSISNKKNKGVGEGMSRRFK